MRWLALFAAVVWTPLAVAAEPEAAVADRVTALGRVGTVLAGSMSPDGKTAVVTTAITGVPQIWAVPANGGWPTQLTTFEDPAAG